MTFGSRLRARRAEAHLTQDQLGEALGVSKAAVSRWESDKDYPSFGVLPKLSRALGVSLDYLVDGAAPGRVAEDRAAYRVDSAQSADEAALLVRFRSMGHRRQRALLELIASD